jgi:hypothetical protein
VKLDQTRLVSGQPYQLVNYSWQQFYSEVIKLLDRAKAGYSAVKKRAVLQKHGSTSSLGTKDRSNNLTDNLRELAAAANAMQGDTAAPGVIKCPDETALLPRYVIKTVGLDGWEHVEDAEQWTNLLARRSREVWADGVVNMIVELVDVHTGGKNGEMESEGMASQG